MSDTVILLSGGLDSTVVLASALAEGRSPSCVSFDYGQRHADAELAAAVAVAAHYNVPQQTVDLKPAFAPLARDSALTGGSGGPYVPNRNAILLSIGVAYAESLGAADVRIGAHREDYAGFPDCRPAFVEAFDRVAQLGTTHGVRVCAPFSHHNKSALVRRGVELSAPLHLTYTCYAGTHPACGECAACRTRKRAFMQAKKYDPIQYAYGAPLAPPDVKLLWEAA